jgi:alpha-beta hydrolase superfamily lysophospholipase
MVPFSSPTHEYRYIESGSSQLFGAFHNATGSDAAVLICAPWGWDETASYRCRRIWAQRLAAGGHPTLRFDLPGTGDSSGSPGDDGLFDSWTEAVTDAAAWLRERSGGKRVAVLGMGLGGLLAAAASEAGADIDELILWATPSRGKRFLREAESFARMQAWGAGRGEESPMPEGWVEAGGFVISAETAAALRALPAPLTSVPRRLRRALLLDRDGLTPDSALADRLEASGVETVSGPGPGWGAMVAYREAAAVPEETIGRVEQWLAAGDAIGHPAPGPSGLPPEAGEEMQLADLGISEHAITVAQSAGDSFGVVAQPLAGRKGDVCGVFLNAGEVRHIGPNRNWVENARRWAGLGVPTVRVDLEGIGEAGGDRSGHPGVAGFYDELYAPQIARVLDELERLGLGPRFVCVGLCSGAYWSLQFADRDPRVVAGVMLNAGAIEWDPDLRSRRDARLLSKSVSSAESWRRLLRGDVDLKRKVSFLRRFLASWLRRGTRAVRPHVDDSSRDPVALFDRLRDRDKRIAMAFSINEPVLAELTADGLIRRMGEWPNIQFDYLHGEDHALGPIDAQRSAAEIMDRELATVLGAEIPTAAPQRS